MPTRRRRKKEEKKEYSGFSEEHPDSRCVYKVWADRLAVLSDLDAVALRAAGEHMTSRAFAQACRVAWQKANFQVHAIVTASMTAEAGDPPAVDEDKDAKKKMVS